MNRSQSILSVVKVLVVGFVLVGVALLGLKSWQAASLVEDEADESTEVASAADRPVKLWHEDARSKSAAPSAEAAKSDAHAERSRTPDDDEAAAARFAWAITPKEGEEADESSLASMPAEAPAELAAVAEDGEAAPLESVAARAEEPASVEDAVPAEELGRLPPVEGAPDDPVVGPSDEAIVQNRAGRPLQLASTENMPFEATGAAAGRAEQISASDQAPQGETPPGDAAPSDKPVAEAPKAGAERPAAESPGAAADAPAASATRTPAEEQAATETAEPSETGGAAETKLRAKVARPKTPAASGSTVVQEAPSVAALDESPAWPQAASLRAALASLASDPDGNAWSSLVSAELAKLEAAPSFDSPESAAALKQLRELSDTVRKQVPAEESSPLHTKLLRANYALQRRLAVWQAAHVAAAIPDLDQPAQVNRRELAAATSAVDAFLSATGRQQEWRGFLLLEDVVSVIRSEEETNSTNGRSLARCILARLDSTLLTPQQAKFLDRPVVHRWTEHLQKWAVEPVDRAALLKLVERFESTPTSSTARDIARANQVLRWAPDERLTDVGAQLNLHYRNANVRVAVSADFANRLLPPLRHFDAPVDDVIRNTRVVGRSQTAARSRLVLFPDRTRWSIGLDVLGSVSSETQGQRGPAVFFQDGQARFHARKLVQVDHQGIHTKPAFGVAESSSQLTGVETDFDGVPLMNRLARSIAQKQYEGESGAAQSEVDQRIADEASRRLDDEVKQLLHDTQAKFETQLLRPLAELGLEPTPIDFETTRARLIARYRLAGSHQLAAHSPRPQAPANSLLSLQLHESALNNVIEQLRFDGRQVELPELVKELAARLGRKQVEVPDELPEDVTVQFAHEDAVRLNFEGGRVTITMQIAELSQGRDNRWKNFTVRGHYAPQISGRQVHLVRDGVIELGGDRKRIGDQVALRAIFAKVLSKNRPIPLLPTTLSDRRELADVEASQAVVEDGWIGITLAQGGSVARQPAAQPSSQR